MSPPDSALLYEPRTEGHHLAWLRFIAEDLLSAGFRLSLAADLRPTSAERVRSQLGDLVSSLNLFSAYDAAGRRHAGGQAASVAFCLRQCGAQRVFLCALDEIASDCWRRAACGVRPPRELQGRMGGIYHRPRFLAAPWWSPNRWLKQAGFHRLMSGRWLQPLIFVDPYLARDCAARYPQASIAFLPGPCPSGLTGDSAEARLRMELPAGRVVFLFYGTGQRRKGLHVAVEAMLGMETNSTAFLLCVGQQNPRGQTARRLDQLVRMGRARLIDRYVSSEEERLSFLAADAVLLPYLNHFGTSAVLFQAAAANRMVIVSDEQLLGQLTREHGLGLLFPSGNSTALRERMNEAAAGGPAGRAAFGQAGMDFAAKHSRAAFRQALLASLGVR